MRITRLEAKGIGPFEDLNIEFKPKPAGMENKAEIHILTGENGTGKSTILMMLASCGKLKENDNSLIIERSRWKYDSMNNIGFENSSHAILSFEDIVKIRLSPNPMFSFNEEGWIAIGLFDKWKDNKTEYDEDFMNNHLKIPKNLSNVILDYPVHQYNFKENKVEMLFSYFSYSGYRISKGTGVVNIKEITSNPLENAVNFEKSIDSDLILDWVANVITKGLLSKNRGKEVIKISAVQKIEKALSDITGKKIEFDLEESLKVSVRVNNVSLSFNTLPDGLKSIISWLSDLLMRLDRINWADKTKSILEQNFILFLDEIEVHLHPSWQRKILPVVQDLFPNAQIFISTHSPFVVGSVDGARVYKFNLDENNNSVLDSEYWTEDGNSYQYYLREVFDIENEFGVKIDESLQELQRLKEKALKGSAEDYEKFMILSDKLLNENPNSVELSSIVGFEKRKLEKQFPTQPVTA